MKKQKATKEVERYLFLGSDHDKGFALKVWLEALETNAFPDPVTPLRLFIELRNSMLEVRNQPAEVIQLFEQQTAGMIGPDKLFIIRHLYWYFRNTVFEGDDNDEGENFLTDISEPLGAVMKRLSRETGNKEEAKTGDLRQLLKDTIRQEMERLPEYLQSLEPKDRVNVLCKMMPYVFPKVEAVHASEGEPFSFP